MNANCRPAKNRFQFKLRDWPTFLKVSTLTDNSLVLFITSKMNTSIYSKYMRFMMTSRQINLNTQNRVSFECKNLPIGSWTNYLSSPPPQPPPGWVIVTLIVINRNRNQEQNTKGRPENISKNYHEWLQQHICTATETSRT